MLQLKAFVLFGGLLALAGMWPGCQVLAEDASTICPPDSDDGDGDRDGNDTQLCPSFQALRETIDPDVLVELVQSHYQCNSKFRKAVCYYNTNRFQVVALQLQQTEAYRTMLSDLRSAGVDTTDVENIMDIFSCLELPPPEPNKTCNCKALRGHTFVGDLLAAMPHQEVHDYTAGARSSHTNFALFVDTVTAPEFQSRMRANMMKPDAMRPLRVLRRYGWDMPQLLRAVTTVLTW